MKHDETGSFEAALVSTCFPTYLTAATRANPRRRSFLEAAKAIPIAQHG